MRSLRVFVVAVIASSVSCGGPSPASPSSWGAPPILAQVPSDTPYLFAALDAPSAAVRDRVFAQFEGQMTQFIDKALHLSADQILDAAKPGDRAMLAPLVRAGLSVVHELNPKDMKHLASQLGLAEAGRGVLYGLSIWPVLRLEVANPVRLRQVIERAMTASGAPVAQGSLDGRAYWTAAGPKVTIIASVLAHDAVFAVVPSPAVASVLPQLLGTQPPAQPLTATAAVPDLLARHHFSRFVFGYFDLQRLVAIFAGSGATELDKPIHAAIGPVPPACSADVVRLAALAPRAVFGYHRVDEAGYDGAMVFESPPAVATALARLRAAAPGVTAALDTAPLFSIGAAFNFDELVALLRRVTAEIHAHPFGCPQLAELNRSSDELAAKLTHPFPAMLRTLTGASLVVDNGEVLPPTIDGHLLISGSGVTDLVSMAAALHPALASIQVKGDGVPVEVPAQKLGIPLGLSIHAAMSRDRLVLAAGDHSAHRASAGLAVATPRSSPLFTIGFDGKRLLELMSSVGASNPNFASLGKGKLSLEATEAGLRFAVVGTWPELPPPPPPPPATSAAL